MPSEARDRTSSFTSITGRFAFHRKSGKPSGSPTAKNDSEDVHSGRDRAMTASSYASTAHPPKLENLPSSDFGNDFGDLFSSFAAQQRKSAILEESPLPQPPPLAMRSVSETLPRVWYLLTGMTRSPSPRYLHLPKLLRCLDPLSLHLPFVLIGLKMSAGPRTRGTAATRTMH